MKPEKNLRLKGAQPMTHCDYVAAHCATTRESSHLVDGQLIAKCVAQSHSNGFKSWSREICSAMPLIIDAHGFQY